MRITMLFSNKANSYFTHFHFDFITKSDHGFYHLRYNHSLNQAFIIINISIKLSKLISIKMISFIMFFLDKFTSISLVGDPQLLLAKRGFH